MRWVGICVGGILLFLIGGYSIGIFLPATYEATSSRAMDASLDEVWSALNNFEDNPISANMARHVIRLEDFDGGPAWTEDIGSSILTIRTSDLKKNSFLSRTVKDNVVPLSATIEIHLSRHDGKTTVSMKNQTTIREGTWHVPLFRLSLYFTDALETGVTDYLDQVENDVTAEAA